MGLRFRKSIKIAPGVKFNLNKKSVGLTFGGKGAHYTINSSGKKTASVGIPGTGLSYSTSTGGGSGSKTNTSSSVHDGTGQKKMGCGGCLLAFLGICLAIAILGFILNYAWIPGIIAAIYFAKKTPDAKQKKIRVGISIAVVIISFIAFLGTMFAPDLTSLTVNWSKTEYDITEEVELDLVVTEEDAKISYLDISDNDIARVTYSNDVATVHFVGEGTADIYFIADGEIESNSTTITVIDKAAQEQREKEEAELKAKEDAEKKAQEEAQQAAAQQTQQEETVWIPSSGSKYHAHSGCSGMENPTEVPISTAKSRGFTACQRCH